MLTLLLPAGCGDEFVTRSDAASSSTTDTATTADTALDDTALDDTAVTHTTTNDDTTNDDTTVIIEDSSVATDVADDTSTFVGCLPSACVAPLPDLGDEADWRHSVTTPLTTVQGDPRHRGQDLYLRASDPQWALAKFAYGAFDDDLKDEDVDIYVLEGCGATWSFLATATTTEEGTHPTVEGVEDSGGRVYYQLPEARRLGLGRHRLAFVVRGDHSVAYQLIEVLPDDPAIVVTDVDGTQTSSEVAEFGAVFLGIDPEAQPHGAEVLEAFAERGYRIFYLTARPEWLHARTHEWLGAHGYPPGLVRTSTSFTGVNGDAAIAYKSEALAGINDRFPGALRFTIGNTETDAAAFAGAGVPPERSYLYQFDPGALGTRVDDYATLVPVARAQPARCD